MSTISNMSTTERNKVYHEKRARVLAQREQDGEPVPSWVGETKLSDEELARLLVDDVASGDSMRLANAYFPVEAPGERAHRTPGHVLWSSAYIKAYNDQVERRKAIIHKLEGRLRANPNGWQRGKNDNFN